MSSRHPRPRADRADRSRRSPVRLLALALAVVTATLSIGLPLALPAGLLTPASAKIPAASIPTAAIPAAGPAPAARVAPATSVPSMIVLDASGSMNQDDAPGPRIDAAKSAVTGLLGSLPADAQVGLMVYGTKTGSTDAEKAAGCQDISTLAPVGPLDAAALGAQVQGITASGYTPIGNALKAAAAALPTEGPRSIVLVSDGEDTCAPPAPCDVARDLRGQGVDLTVHTVGFKVDPTAREQLTCIADATGGTYSDAADSTQLSQALQAKVEYAITGYTLAGTPVSGADQGSEQAPLLNPGQYVDTFAVGGSGDSASAGTTKYYTIPVQTGMRPYVSATLVPPQDSVGSTGTIGVDVELLRRDLKRCNDDREFVVLQGGRNEAPTAVLDGPTFGDAGSAYSCPTDGVGIIKVSRIGKAWADQAMPMEIVVRMEPPADTTGLLPEASKGDLLAAPVHGAPTAVTGGSSFNDAPRLTSGTTYSDTIVTGESRFYRVPVQWGQRVSYLITETGPAQPTLGQVGATVWVDVFNPVRKSITRLQDISGRSWFADSTEAEPFSASTDYPVRYTNRSGYEQGDLSLDGDYYLRVNANRHDDQPSSTDFLVTVVVSGDVEPGPTYLAPGSIPPSGSTAATSTPTTPVTASGAPTPGSSTTGSTPPTVSSTTDSIDVATTASNGPVSDEPLPGWVWALGGAVVAGLIVAAVLVLQRRRQTTGGPGHGPGDSGPFGPTWS